MIVFAKIVIACLVVYFFISVLIGFIKAIKQHKQQKQEIKEKLDALEKSVSDAESSAEDKKSE